MIPRLIHQTFKNVAIPPKLTTAMHRVKLTNPDFEHRFWTDRSIETFISAEYGAAMLARFRRINPKYGAARADLFRYLCLYRLGGVYLDIKSGLSCPLSEIVRPDDSFLLGQWDTTAYVGYGQHPELAAVPGGEYQQWHISCAPEHPFLRAVIDRVVENIDRYIPETFGTGHLGVVRLTGPIAYTLAIHPLLDQHPHRFLANPSGLVYDAVPHHMAVFHGHYRVQTESIVMEPVDDPNPDDSSERAGNGNRDGAG